MKAFGIGLVALGCWSGCSPVASATATSFAVELRAVEQDGAPLSGVSFTLDRNAVGTTDAEGRLIRQVHGKEGSTIKVSAECPVDFETPEQPQPLHLTRTRAVTTSAAQPLTLEVRCQKRLSDIVVIVRAERGQQLPVLLDGKPVATTDDDGVAHVLLRRPRTDKSVQLGIDTTSRPRLRPVSPSRSYELHHRDAVVVFEPSFMLAPSRPGPVGSMSRAALGPP